MSGLLFSPVPRNLHHHLTHRHQSSINNLPLLLPSLLQYAADVAAMDGGGSPGGSGYHDGYHYVYYHPHLGMSLPHMLPYHPAGGEELPYGACLAPFPPGLPVPLPPEAAEELQAAMAAQHAAWAAAAATAATASCVDGTAAAADPTAAAAGAAETAASASAPEPADGAADVSSARSNGGFLAMLHAACTAPAPSPAARSRRQGGASRAPPAQRRCFNPGAVLREFEARFSAAGMGVALQKLPPQQHQPQHQQHLQQHQQHQQPSSLGAVNCGIGKPRRSSKAASAASGVETASSTGHKISSLASAGSGQLPGGKQAGSAAKPVVVAVRAWRDEGSGSDSPRWRISTAQA